MGVITATLEQHAAQTLPSQDGSLSVGMLAASGVSAVSAAQHARLTASAASAENIASAIALQVGSQALTVYGFMLSKDMQSALLMSV